MPTPSRWAASARQLFCRIEAIKATRPGPVRLRMLTSLGEIGVGASFRVSNFGVPPAGDDDDVVEARGREGADEPCDERPPIGVGQQRLGSAHARRIARGEDDRGQHPLIVTTAINRRNQLERKEFWLALTSPAVLPRLAQLFGRGVRGPLRITVAS